MRKIKQKNGKMDGHLSHKLKPPPPPLPRNVILWMAPKRTRVAVAILSLIFERF